MVQPHPGATAGKTWTTADGRTEAERRAIHRIRTLKAAHAVFNEGRSGMSCTVHDITEVGAHLVFDEEAVVPDEFELYVELDGFKVPCQRIWHKGNVHGVHFTGPKERTKVFRSQSLSGTGPAGRREEYLRLAMEKRKQAWPHEGPPPAEEAAPDHPHPPRSFGKR